MLDAKKEYIAKLSETYDQYINRYISHLYKDASRNNSGKSLMKFQMKLKQIPSWSSATIEEHTKAIESKSPWLQDLIAAVFVSFVKVLSSIRLNPDSKPDIRLKLPSNESFTHQLFITIAREYYEDPSMVRHADFHKKSSLVHKAVESTVRDMLPLQQILTAYLGKSINEDHTLSSAEFQGQEDEDVGEGGGDEKGIDSLENIIDDDDDDDDDDDETDRKKHEPILEDDFPEPTQPMQHQQKYIPLTDEETRPRTTAAILSHPPPPPPHPHTSSVPLISQHATQQQQRYVLRDDAREDERQFA
jgi:hypothetical protein